MMKDLREVLLNSDLIINSLDETAGYLRQKFDVDLAKEKRGPDWIMKLLKVIEATADTARTTREAANSMYTRIKGGASPKASTDSDAIGPQHAVESAKRLDDTMLELKTVLSKVVAAAMLHGRASEKPAETFRAVEGKDRRPADNGNGSVMLAGEAVAELKADLPATPTDEEKQNQFALDSFLTKPTHEDI